MKKSQTTYHSLTDTPTYGGGECTKSSLASKAPNSPVPQFGNWMPFCRGQVTRHLDSHDRVRSTTQSGRMGLLAEAIQLLLTNRRTVGLIPRQRQLGGRWDCHTLCPDIGAGVLVSGHAAAAPQWPPGWPPTAWWMDIGGYHKTQEALHPPLPTGLRLLPALPRSVGLGPIASPPSELYPGHQSAACHSQSTPALHIPLP